MLKSTIYVAPEALSKTLNFFKIGSLIIGKDGMKLNVISLSKSICYGCYMAATALKMTIMSEVSCFSYAFYLFFIICKKFIIKFISFFKKNIIDYFK